MTTGDSPIGSNSQHRLSDQVSANTDPPINFHGLRHTYASRLAMRGVPLAVIAAQLGHSDTRMVEKHYGHLAPNYVADTVRTAFGRLGIVEASNIIPMISEKARPLEPAR
jgi:integrase